MGHGMQLSILPLSFRGEKEGEGGGEFIIIHQNHISKEEKISGIS